MTLSRRRIMEDKTLDNFTAQTIQRCVWCIARFARHFKSLPVNLGLKTSELMYRRPHSAHVPLQRFSSLISSPQPASRSRRRCFPATSPTAPESAGGPGSARTPEYNRASPRHFSPKTGGSEQTSTNPR
jgi:hypothetical protein